MLGSFLNENSIHEHLVGMILMNGFFLDIFTKRSIIDPER